MKKKKNVCSTRDIEINWIFTSRLVIMLHAAVIVRMLLLHDELIRLDDVKPLSIVVVKARPCDVHKREKSKEESHRVNNIYKSAAIVQTGNVKEKKN